MNLFSISSVYSLIALGTSLIIMSKILPAIIKEGRVRNGLKDFRKWMLLTGGSLFLLTLVAFVIISARYVLSLETVRNLSWILLMVFSTIVLIAAIGKYKMYTFQFSDKNIKRHREIEDVEDGLSVIVKKKGR